MKIESFTDYVEELVREKDEKFEKSKKQCEAIEKQLKQMIQQHEKSVKFNIEGAKRFYGNGVDVKLGAVQNLMGP
ncbi:MAG: hypothetical protein LBC41_05800 [Clostridiales bacterium]|jgi:threonyl-tRNA synthetase|nr:hypothetical protein [Clostridiales bacterium]